MPVKKKIIAPKVFASESVLQEKKNEIKEMETMLGGGRADRDISYRNDKIQDPDLIRHEIAKRKKFIEVNTPKKLTGVEANRAYKRVKELEAEFKDKMPTSKLFNQRYPRSDDRASKAIDFERGVQQQVAFQKMQPLVNEFRNLVARIDPQNRTLGNIERLRRAR
jgi:hypothetical protein